ncbi:thiamine biosynthesis protein-like protein (Thi-4) [Aulographum hederae CBS 113979]|uniref:Thiamine biosynthesis protein-like protein (Thi-4) n=1 Tax=Aulographum hederae CBS 113979 TaxID=1176131 RepID=A0A6G1GMQ2_9PEZI|nr:thiamine biosynthesis protein-like protein (Thi-4) [Aulographum hederae CBS 113979]
MPTRRILVIAGSDSSGGAGLEADQKVIAAHGCYAMTATTALTAQNTQGVEGIHEVPSEFVRKCVDAVVGDVGVDVVKTGMLASAETITVVAEAIIRHKIPITVIDPVMVSTSGHQLLPQPAVLNLVNTLLPHATLLTPNLPEARLLLQTASKPISSDSPESVDDLKVIAKDIRKLGPKYVLLKGGHLPLTRGHRAAKTEEEKAVVVNVLAGPGDQEVEIFETEYLRSENTHGTGCSLASAIASNLALGKTMRQAVNDAILYVEAGIKTAPTDIGKGSGPINHFHSTYTLPFAPGNFIDYVVSRPDVRGPWKEHTEHDFVQQLAAGTLPIERFRYYLIQDYLFLIQFSRANALLAYKARSLGDLRTAVDNVAHLQEEMKLHIQFCDEFGLSPEEVEGQEESQACTAYTRYILDIGHTHDYFSLQIALLPCLLGYGLIARRLFDDPATVRGDAGNRYWKWIETYVAADYVEAVGKGRELVEKLAAKESPSRIEELVKIFIHATKMETGFWDMGSWELSLTSRSK